MITCIILAIIISLIIGIVLPAGDNDDYARLAIYMIFIILLAIDILFLINYTPTKVIKDYNNNLYKEYNTYKVIDNDTICVRTYYRLINNYE